MSGDALIDVLRGIVDEHDDAEEERRHSDLSLSSIDRGVRRYHRQLAGKEPWTDFEELVPPSVQRDPAYIAACAASAEDQEAA
jgi:hypothetical protein